MKYSSNIEKLFLEYIKDIGEALGGCINICDPKILEEGDPKILGRQMQVGQIF
mgnify:CR=1 FL=1